MTTAGTATAAFAIEETFNGSLPSTPNWFQPGVDLSVTGPTIDRTQEPVRQPDQATPAAHRPGRFNGSVTVEFSLAGAANEWEQLVFHGGSNDLPLNGGSAPSFKAYFATEFLDGTATDFVASGAIVTECEISVEEDGDVTVSLTIEFAEKADPALAPADGDITVPSAEAVYPYHGGSVTACGVQQTNLNSATITISSLHRLRYGLDQIATGGVVGGIEVEVDTEAVYTEQDQLDLATTGTSGGSLVDEAPDVVIELSNANATSKTYTVNGARPDTHEWSSLVDPGDDLVESVTFLAENVTSA
jgi:hypothetical protein